MTLIVAMTFCVLSCSDGAVEPGEGEPNATSPKSDQGLLADVDWANEFFLTQIYDAQWNKSGMENDTTSNSCGPASLAMVMRARESAPEGHSAQMAIDHARALMFPEYPEIDPAELPEGASVYVEEEEVCVEDNGRPVYFDLVEELPSIPQGIIHGGGTPVFGYSWDELEDFLEAHGSAIAYGHITDAWRDQFSGDYGAFDPGAIPHFIALFPASSAGDYVVCDPMHRGGAVIMSQLDLKTFFKSPVNVYDTTIRLLAWQSAPESAK